MALSKHEEDARHAQDLHWNRETLSATIPPGSSAEAEAIQAIDMRREAERVARSDNDPGKRRRRHARYWRARGVHVDV